MVYLSPDIWRLIFEFDRTYVEVFNNVLCELRAFFVKRRTNKLLLLFFDHYEIYKNNYLFLTADMQCVREPRSLVFIVKRLIHFYRI
jgi:hypothetical protein